MSDFYTNVYLTRVQLSEMLSENEEHAMWVLADIAEHLDLDALIAALPVIEADRETVWTFYFNLAALIRNEQPLKTTQ